MYNDFVDQSSREYIARTFEAVAHFYFVSRFRNVEHYVGDYLHVVDFVMWICFLNVFLCYVSANCFVFRHNTRQQL